MPSSVTIAIVGLGSQGQEHLHAVRASALPVQLVAVVDPRGVPEGVVVPAGCGVYSAVEDLPDRVQAVVVATPPVTYRELVPGLLKAGKHVLLEKPLGISLAESLEFTDLAIGNRRVLMPAVQRRFHPAYQCWSQWRERVGHTLEAQVGIKIKHEGAGWRSDIQLAGGGALFDLGFHAIDLVQQLFGDVRLVSACFFDGLDRPSYTGMDVKADLLLETETFQPIRVVVERAAPEKQEQVQIRGTLGTLTVGRGRLCFVSKMGERMEQPFAADWTIAMEQQLGAFLTSIRLCEDGDAHAWDALWNGAAAMRIMGEAYAHGML
jgi:predicted dehydrogenase